MISSASVLSPPRSRRRPRAPCSTNCAAAAVLATLTLAAFILLARQSGDAGRQGRIPEHQAAGLAALERPRLKASEISRLTVEQAAVQHATPAVRYHTAGGVDNPAQHTPSLPGFRRQEVVPLGTGSAASQSGSSALLAQFEARGQAQVQSASVSRSTRGQAMAVQPPPAYLYDLPDPTLYEAQLDRDLSFARSLKMVALLPSCLRCGPSEQPREAACAAALMAACTATAPLACYQKAAEKACGTGQAEAAHADPALGLYAAFQRTFPLLQEAYQWKSSQVVYSWLEDGLCSPQQEASASSCQSNATQAQEQLAEADVIFADVQHLEHVSSHFPRALIMVMDVSASASMHPALLERESVLSPARVLRVLKPYVLRPLGLNLPPLFEGSAHLAAIPGTERLAGYRRSMGWDISDIVLSKPMRGLNPVLSFRHFLEQGSSLQYARFAGLFAQNYSHWRPGPLRARSTDILHLELNPTGSAELQQALERHYRVLAASLRYLNQAYPTLSVKTVAANPGELGGLVEQLLDSKLVVSPVGPGEVTELDYLAVMCGCLLVKARGRSFAALPDLFQHEETGAAVNPDWSNLRATITALLQDLPGAQFTASKAFHRLLEFSDTPRYAGLLARSLHNTFAQLGPARFALIRAGLAANATKSLEFLP